jgi:hypothetical protein
MSSATGRAHWLAALTLCLGIFPTTGALAQLSEVPCDQVQRVYTAYANEVMSVGGRVRAAETSGVNFQSVTMQDGYDLERYPLGTSEAAARSEFRMNVYSNVITGYFAEVFTGRTRVDRSQLWWSSNGALWLRSLTWGNSWTQLQRVTCYLDPQWQVTIEAQADEPGYATDFYTFVLRPE